jgi:hypothetical protein
VGKKVFRTEGTQLRKTIAAGMQAVPAAFPPPWQLQALLLSVHLLFLGREIISPGRSNGCSGLLNPVPLDYHQGSSINSDMECCLILLFFFFFSQW